MSEKGKLSMLFSQGFWPIIIIGIMGVIGLVGMAALLKSAARNSEKIISDEMKFFRQEFSQQRMEILNESKNQESRLREKLSENFQLQNVEMHKIQNEFVALSKNMREMTDKNRELLDSRFVSLQQLVFEQLEKMRVTVDEKLHKTLEERLGQSFMMVSQKLEQVHKGLGEMQSLAQDVGGLKKVLTNVKTRGILGEIQLSNILEEILAAEQYAVNVRVNPESKNHVEFAVKLPGKTQEDTLYLPIDSKFPLTTYHDLVDAYELQGGESAKDVKIIQTRLLSDIKGFAKEISEKYITPPYTTDFAMLFLPIEGLYAEVIRHHEVTEEIRKKYKIIITGPSTLAAILNSFHMGFKTLAIEKRSTEVWKLLAAVKTQFESFGKDVEKASKKMQEVQTTFDELVGKRSRGVLRTLKNIEALPVNEAQNLLSSEVDVSGENTNEIL